MNRADWQLMAEERLLDAADVSEWRLHVVPDMCRDESIHAIFDETTTIGREPGGVIRGEGLLRLTPLDSWLGRGLLAERDRWPGSQPIDLEEVGYDGRDIEAVYFYPADLFVALTTCQPFASAACSSPRSASHESTVTGAGSG